jgi:hypothetical protein
MKKRLGRVDPCLSLFVQHLPAVAAATTAAVATAAATAATTATTTATTAITAATAAATRGTIVRLIDSDRTTVEVLPVHFLHGRLGRCRILEGYETEAARTPCVAIQDHFDFVQLAKTLESAAQTVIGGVPAEAAYE